MSSCYISWVMLSRSRTWRARGLAARRAPVPTVGATLFALLVLLHVDHAGAADRAAANVEAAKASKELAARNFRSAAERYESAFKESPNPKWLLSAASAWMREGEAARAANAYARYLRVAPERAPQRAAAKKELAALAPKLGRLQILATGASLVVVDGVEWDPASAVLVYVPVGPHLVEARFPDESVTASPSARAGAVEPVTLARSESPVEKAVATVEAPPPPPEAPKPPPEPRRKPLPPLVVYIAGGLTLVAAGATLLSGLDVQRQRETFDKDRSQQNLDLGKDKQMRTNVLIGVTGAVLAFTALAAVWLVDWSGPRANAKVGAGLGSLHFRADF